MTAPIESEPCHAFIIKVWKERNGYSATVEPGHGLRVSARTDPAKAAYIEAWRRFCGAAWTGVRSIPTETGTGSKARALAAAKGVVDRFLADAERG